MCEDQGVDILCPVGYYVTITSAMYGRQNDDICPADTTVATPNCEVENADNVVKKYCDGYQGCYVNADSETFEEECDGSHSYLNVTYDCDGMT